MTRSDLIDKEDGENRAVRSFLMLYGGATGLSVGQMLDHMEMSGWDGCWPAWVSEVARGHHLTKGGAQDWLRYLFGLEAKAIAPAAQPVAKDEQKGGNNE